MQRKRGALVLDVDTRVFQRLGARAQAGAQPRHRGLSVGVGATVGRVFGTMVADDVIGLEVKPPEQVVDTPARDDRHLELSLQAVQPVRDAERDVRIGRPRDDGCQRAVEVEGQQRLRGHCTHDGRAALRTE